MLSQIRLTLDTGEIRSVKSSALQGVLFELLDTDYVEQLHTQQLHPYSQYVIREQDASVWVINALNEDAVKNIIEVLMLDEIQGFHIEHGDMDVKIIKKEVKKVSKKELVNDFYYKDADKYINLSIMTPMSFKQQGEFVIWPDLRLIYQSLMNKYSASSTDVDMFDEDILDQLLKYSKIVSYRIHTTKFPLEGIAVPGFAGDIGIKITGNGTIARYIRLLMQFGEYSGVGIKTGMGMGAIKIRERSGKEKV